MVGILKYQAASSDKEPRGRLQASNGRNITLLVEKEKTTFGGHNVILPDYQGTTQFSRIL